MELRENFGWTLSSQLSGKQQQHEEEKLCRNNKRIVWRIKSFDQNNAQFSLILFKVS